MSRIWQQVKDDARVFVLAEIGVNHNGDMELARQLIDAAVDAGADGVKFQAFKAVEAKIPTAPLAEYQKRSEFDSALEMSRSFELSAGQMRDLSEYCRDKGVPYILTVFDVPTIADVEPLDLPFYKVGSGEVVNLPLLKELASTGKPIVLSTGMSYLDEVDRAVRTIEECGNSQLVLLHCVSNYPASPGEANLRCMETLRRAFGYPVGYSDHTLGTHVTAAAVACGACFIEKHITVDKELPGPDHAASATPEEFRAMVDQIRDVELALGTGRKRPVPAEEEMRVVARKGLVSIGAINAGDRFNRGNTGVKKPCSGIPAEHLELVLGRVAQADIAKDSLITWDAILGERPDES